MLIDDQRVRVIRIHLVAEDAGRGGQDPEGGSTKGEVWRGPGGREGGGVMHACVGVAYRPTGGVVCASRRALAAAVELPLGGTRHAASPGPVARPVAQSISTH